MNNWDLNNPPRLSIDSNMSFEFLSSDSESSQNETSSSNSQMTTSSQYSIHSNTDDSSNQSSAELGNEINNIDNINKILSEHEEASIDSNPSSSSSSLTSISSVQTWEEEFLDDENSITSVKSNLKTPSDIDETNIYEQSPILNEEYVSPSEISSCSKTRNKEACIRNKFGCFNINNQYSHECCAELMIKGQFSYLSIQEPFSSNTKENKSWASYRIANLASANFKAYESKHQVVIIDESSWGGKNLEEIQCYQEGRIMAIPIRISKNQTLGIISIYAITSGEGTLANGTTKAKIRYDTTTTVEEIYNKWLKTFPDMIISIIGDLQETWSVSNLDNFGLYRKEVARDGILNCFFNTHFSIVRQDRELEGNHYWTRRGKQGSRGLDHILLPNNDMIFTWNFSGHFEEDLGNNFYNSDHTLLSCTFDRWCPNEKISYKSKTIYKFDKIYNIKIKDDLSFDDSKFKCDALYKQEELYNKIHKLTEPSSNLSTKWKIPIDIRINKLIKEIWETGIKNNQTGENNNLVDISPEMATQIESISLDFRQIILDLMNDLKLTTEGDDSNNANMKRHSLGKTGCTKIYNTLPITSKIRLLIKIVKRHINNLKNINSDIEFEKRLRTSINNTHLIYKEIQPNEPNTKSMDTINKQNLKSKPTKDLERNQHKMKIPKRNFITNIEKKIIKLINSKCLREKLVDLITCISEDKDLWQLHTDAIRHSRPNNDVATDKVYGKTLFSKGGDLIDEMDDSDFAIINNFAEKISCKHLLRRTPHNEKALDLRKSVEFGKKWQSKLKEYKNWAGYINTADTNQLEQMPKFIQEALKFLKKLRNQLSYKQRIYKHDKINYNCETNNMSALTSTLKPKEQSVPTVHDLYYDVSINQYRQCVNVQEQLIATKQHHDQWMQPSKAKKACFFAELVKEGTLGIRGIKTFPDKKFTRNDIKDVVHNSEQLDESTIQSIIKAHGKHTAEEFRAPSSPNPLFNYPFYFINKQGDLANTFIEDDFWKAIKKIPTKARHDDFHLAIFGRMNINWANSLLKIAKLILVMRLVPKNINILSRIPIPKPDRPNEYRPLSVCDDLFCFVNSVFTKHASIATELAKTLHDGVTAYRPGKGCQTLVSIELAAREDCIESGKMCALIMEDIEKFFDRLTAENILNAMAKAGFPAKGYMEFKGSSMSFKTVVIKTNKGEIITKFECGIEQGNPDSPRAANLIIMNIHNMWKKASKTNSNYIFSISDPNDTNAEVGATGFSDDNQDLVWNGDIDELIKLIQTKINMTGDLSIVTKLGRKGKKCAILLFNATAEAVQKLKRFFSVAWSFQDDKPIKEAIEVTIFMQAKEARKIDPNIKTNAEVTFDNDGSLIINEIDDFSNIKHLGLTMRTDGDTTVSANKVIANIKNKIALLNVKNLQDSPQRHSCNMLLNTLHSYATLENNINLLDLKDCDKLLIQNLRKNKGLSNSDTLLSFCIKEKNYGFGYKAFVDAYLCSIARELDIALNGKALHADTTRARLRAHTANNNTSKNIISLNHIRDAIEKLGDFGFYFRDSQDGILNYLIEEIRIWKKKYPVGLPKHSKSNANFLGEGNPDLRSYTIGTHCHNLIKKYIRHKKSNTISQFMKSLSCKKIKKFVTHLNNSWQKSKTQERSDSLSLFQFFEWTWNENDKTPEANSKWVHINCNDDLEDNENGWNVQKIWVNIAKKYTTIEIPTAEKNDPIQKSSQNKYTSIFNKILSSSSPLIIATDGGLTSINNTTYATAAISWNLLKIKPNESIESGEWTDRDTIPILQRFCILPKKIGTANVDIGHAELLAFCMQEECLPPNLPRIVIMDAKSVRSKMLELRDSVPTSDRFLLRKMYSGLGRTLMSRAKLHIDIWKDTQRTNACNYKAIHTKKLTHRNLAFIEYIKQCRKSGKHSKWKKEYTDTHPIRCILKIDSHQLNEQGNNKAQKNSRYETLIPNLALLNANHWADKTATLGIELCKKNPKTIPIPTDILIPPSDTRFNIIFNSQLMDKQQSTFIRDKLEQERLNRIKTKEFQGALFRLAKHIIQTPRCIGRKSNYRRYILNLSKTHTRASYKSKQYLALNILEKEDLAKSDNVERFFELLLTKKLLQNNEDILCCPLCKMQKASMDKMPKGNRRHFTLFCQHQRLQSFRNDMEVFIEGLGVLLYYQVEEIGGKDQGEKLFSQINKLLLNRELQKIGRQVSRNNVTEETEHLIYKKEFKPNYLSIENWCKHLGSDTLQDAIKRKLPILQCILGFNTALPDGQLQEAEMGLVDFVYLGLIPKKLEYTICEFLKNITSNINDKEEKKKQYNIMFKTWTRIKNAVKAKNIILHRIIGEIIKDRENELREKLDIPKSKKCKQKLLKLQEEENIINKDEAPLKICKGPTCLPTTSNPMLSQSKSVTPNQIKISHSQCPRCINLNTAMKRCNTLISSIQYKAKESTLVEIANLCMYERDNKQFIGKFLKILLDINGEIQPWLTPTNIIPHNGRGIKINARKPAELAANILIKSFSKKDPFSGIKDCRFCVTKNNLRDSFEDSRTQKIQTCIKSTERKIHCPICIIITSTTNYMKNDSKNKTSHDNKLTQEETHFTPSTTPSVQLSNGEIDINKINILSSPLIKNNIVNHNKLINNRSPKQSRERKKRKTPPKSESNAAQNKNRAHYITEKQEDEQIPSINSPAPPTMQKVTIKQENPPKIETAQNLHKGKRQKKKDWLKIQIPKYAERIRVANIITRSADLNNIISILAEQYKSTVNIANANMINHTIAWNISSPHDIPTSINFTTTTAIHRDKGVYIFPTYIGSYHEGHWIILCLEKHNKKRKGGSNMNGWILDPLPTLHQTEISTIQGKLAEPTFFNTKIHWMQHTRCTPLQETECGPRAIIACFIIATGIKQGYNLLELIAEASTLPITDRNLTSFLARESAYQIAIGTQEQTMIPQIFSTNLSSKLALTIQQKNALTNSSPIPKKNVNENKKTKKTSKRFRKEISQTKARKNKRMKMESKPLPAQASKKIKNNSNQNNSFISKQSDTHPTLSTNNSPKYDRQTEQQKNKWAPHQQSEREKNQIPYKYTSLIKKKNRDTQKNASSKVKTDKKDVPPKMIKKSKKIIIDLKEIPSVDTTTNSTSTSTHTPAISKNSHSLQTLRPGIWLNDEVINQFMEVLNKKETDICATNENHTPSFHFNSFFMRTLGTGDSYDYNRIRRWSRRIRMRENIFQLKSITFPINVNNMHWTLARINLDTRIIEYFDSMGNLGATYLDTLLRFLSDEHQDKLGSPLPTLNTWSKTSWGDKVPQQPNTFDCGVYVCIFAEALSRKLHPTRITSICENPRENLTQIISQFQSTTHEQQIINPLST